MSYGVVDIEWYKDKYKKKKKLERVKSRWLVYHMANSNSILRP